MSFELADVPHGLPADLEAHRPALQAALDQRLHKAGVHGRKREWDDVLSRLPGVRTNHVRLDADTIEIGSAAEVDDPAALTGTLRQLGPWRKGPWRLFGIDIDTEWRSDLKWRRLEHHLATLDDRLVLDVGAGNGYYMLRSLGCGARYALGVDPTVLYLYQFGAVTSFVAPLPAGLMPLRGEDLPPMACFDTVFSMGVLYHRRSPIDHLTELLGQLRPGGELVLETLVIDGDEQESMMPEDRYAKMANVWFIPSPAALELWLWRTGFDNIRTVDVTATTTDEQRATNWMTFQSLADFLDPENPALTVEGLPAPVRAIVLATKPG